MTKSKFSAFSPYYFHVFSTFSPHFFNSAFSPHLLCGDPQKIAEKMRNSAKDAEIWGTGKNISLELLSYKTAFLVALATGARGLELVTLSRADHNITFSRLPSGVRHVSIRLVPTFIPKNAHLDTIPKPLEFPGIAHLFSRNLERLICSVRTLGLYIVHSQELADEDPQQKLFVHSFPSPGGRNYSPHLWELIRIRPSYDKVSWGISSGSMGGMLSNCETVFMNISQ